MRSYGDRPFKTTRFLVHRDYSVLGAVIVQMDDYGLSIYNPGGFIDDVGIGNILSVAPKSRNSLLADIAKRIGLAERTGRGVDRIFEGVLRYGRHKPGYEKLDAFGVTVLMPKEKADFAFLDMVNEYEKKTGKEMKVDALLTVAELKERGKLSFNEIVALTQRKPETIRGEIEEWIADGLIGKFGKGRNDSYILVEDIRNKISGKKLTSWLEEADIKVCYEKIRSWLVANGTIKRAKVCELCAITPKQASKIMDGFCGKFPVFMKGGGRSTVYIWNDNGAIDV